MIKKLIIFLSLIFFSSKGFTLSIRVVDIEYLITENENFRNFITYIENDQTSHKKSFNKTELELKNELQRIEKLKLILDDEALNIEINGYNLKYLEFEKKINEFNLHYENQLNIYRNKIMENILNILKKYSLENNIDLILDSNNYIIALNTINITKKILIELNKLNIEYKLEQYK